MSKVVVILGAGASRSSGAPLMHDFLDVAESVAGTNEHDIDTRGAFDTVFEGIAALRVVHSKSRVDLDNIESVFAAFEMATLLDFKLPTASESSYLAAAMRITIASTLDHAMHLPMKIVDKHRRLLPNEHYSILAEVAAAMLKKATDSVSIMSFNYDIALDYALYWHKVNFTYGISESRPAPMPYLKLHGSLNWAQCPQCRRIRVITVEEALRSLRAHVEQGLRSGVARFSLPLLPLVRREIHCEQSNEPGVVPPVWSKTEHHRELASVWRRAASELRDAENIVVIGYSLPESDQFFRYLYALGSTGATRLKRFWVMNPDTDLEDRFRRLLCPGAEARFRFEPVPFEGGVSRLRELVALV